MFADVRPSIHRTLFIAALIAAMLLSADSAGPASPSQKTSPVQKSRIAENYGKLPLSFEANAGQADKSVKFLSRGSGYGLYLTANEAVLELRESGTSSLEPEVPPTFRPALIGASGAGPGPNAVRPYNSAATAAAARLAVLRMHLTAAGGNAGPVGEEPLPGTDNYFIGNDPAKWHTNVPTYAQVRYRDIYPGIDLVYYGSQRQLEFDYIVAPRADPRTIRLRFDGADNLHLAANGDLAVTIANEALAFHKPVVYQNEDGHRHPVAGGFARLGKHTVGFRLGSYNHAEDAGDRSGAGVFDVSGWEWRRERRGRNGVRCGGG